MLQKFQDHIHNKLPFLLEGKLLIAISGGLDSVVMAHLCKQLDMDITLAHCNFNLRAEESDGDEQFVRDLAEGANMEVFIQEFDTEAYADQHRLSIQMAARELRYRWFHELATQLDFDYILTAHHADDNLETFLINLSRGTGLEGLTGIPEVNHNIVRPFLPFSREDIKTFAVAEKLKWREDSSNSSIKYLRNKLRQEIIPKLKEINPQLLKSLQQTQEHLHDAGEIVEDRIDQVSNRIIDKVSEDALYFNIEELLKLSPLKAYLYTLLNEYGFTEWNDVTDLLQAQSGKQVFSGTHRLLKDRDHLILTEIPDDEHLIIFINSDDREILTPLGTLCIESNGAKTKGSANEISVDKSLLEFPLEVRSWREGDFFYPRGMSGRKKLSKYFKDEKLSLADKEKSLVLCSGNDIIWVMGRRADDRFKITKNTKQILNIEIK